MHNSSGLCCSLSRGTLLMHFLLMQKCSCISGQQKPLLTSILWLTIHWGKSTVTHHLQKLAVFTGNPSPSISGCFGPFVFLCTQQSPAVVTVRDFLFEPRDALSAAVGRTKGWAHGSSGAGTAGGCQGSRLSPPQHYPDQEVSCRTS